MKKGATEFESFLADEINKVKGIYYPVKAGLLRRALIRKAACRKLHPNPHDEFCLPEIGPDYRIISRYESDYRKVKDDPDNLKYIDGSVREPIDVERIHPDGYMILNGHHRWAAACRVGVRRIPVRIVDLTQESDIRKMMAASGSDRRVTLDLDEVVFRPDGTPCLEKTLSFPLGRIYKERLRLGIPALFSMLERSGYDIWVYTARYYSLEYLQNYFRHYRIRVAGIVTGTARKGPAEARKALETLFNAKYRSTVHIDNEAVIRTLTGSRTFSEYRLSGADETWSREVMDVFEKMKKDE